VVALRLPVHCRRGGVGFKMPCHIIVTVGDQYEAEMHQGAFALYARLAARGEPVLWFNAYGAGGTEPTIVAILVPKVMPSDYGNASIYAISHGAGNKFANLVPAVFAALLELFLAAYLRIPSGTKLGKLCMMACNVGKIAKIEEGFRPPEYIEQVPLNLKSYSFEKIVSWNSWVSIYSFVQLLDFCKKHTDQILEYVATHLRPMELSEQKETLAIAKGLSDGMGVAVKGGGKAQPFKSAMADIVKKQFANSAFTEVLALVGKRMVERQHRIASSDAFAKHKLFSSPQGLGLSAMLPKPVSPSLLSGQRQLELLRILQTIFIKEIAQLIVEYESVAWIYYPDKMKLVFYPSNGTGLDGVAKL